MRIASHRCRHLVSHQFTVAATTQRRRNLGRGCSWGLLSFVIVSGLGAGLLAPGAARRRLPQVPRWPPAKVGHAEARSLALLGGAFQYLVRSPFRMMVRMPELSGKAAQMTPITFRLMSVCSNQKPRVCRPLKCANEVRDSSGYLKAAIRDVLESGGAYIVFSTDKNDKDTKLSERRQASLKGLKMRSELTSLMRLSIFMKLIKLEIGRQAQT
jgi:hypothetical protein